MPWEARQNTFLWWLPRCLLKSKQHINSLLSSCANGVWNCGLMLQSYTFLSPWWWLREAWLDLIGRVCMAGRWGSQMGRKRMTGEREGEECTHPLQLSASFDLQEIGIEIMWLNVCLEINCLCLFQTLGLMKEPRDTDHRIIIGKCLKQLLNI